MMSVLSKIAISMLMKLATEKFISKVVVSGMRKLAQKTTNTLDDEIAEAVAEALGE